MRDSALELHIHELLEIFIFLLGFYYLLVVFDCFRVVEDLGKAPTQVKTALIKVFIDTDRLFVLFDCLLAILKVVIAQIALHIVSIALFNW